MRRTICVMAAALAIGIPIILAPSAPAKDGDRKIHVSVDDLGKSAELIGRLGKPLGTWVTIKGKWALPKAVVKEYSPRFMATHVDGAKLEKPVEFNIGQVEAVDSSGKSVMPKPENRRKLDGQTWTLEAYESGEFHITPPEYYEAIGVVPGSVQTPYYFGKFTSEIVGVLQAD